MRVNEPRNLKSTAKYFSLFIVAICLSGIAAANIQAATITVTGNGDAIAVDGQCTLREALTSANTNAALNECTGGAAGLDTINFDTAGVFATPQKINLTIGQLTITDALIINGPGANRLTVSGGNLSGVFKVGFGAILSLDGTTITGGSASVGGGVQSSGTLTISDSVITGNSANFGGGIYYEPYGPLTIVRSTISNNIANFEGGGIFGYGDLRIINSTVSGNSAKGNGGGIYDNGAGNTITIFNSTITQNEAVLWGGIFAYTGGTSVGNSIIAGNTAAGSASDVFGEFISSGHNLIGSGAGSSGFSVAVADQIGTALNPLDPMLGPLQYNDGPTKTHALLPGSPAIDQGSNPKALATDQRRYLRTYDFGGIPDGSGGATDIGAFELDPDTDGDGVRDFSDNCVSTPNPEKIAFASNRDGNFEIYVMNADGSNQTRLTNNTASDLAPNFSRDGSKIVFYSNRNGNNEIYVMNADGTGQTNLTNNAAGDLDPAFSPDGSKIVFRSVRDENTDAIFVMNSDGSGQIRLTSPAGDIQPTFSPDGTRIVFASFRNGDPEIYIMNADGSGQTRLTDTVSNNLFPVFSPDGSKIAFQSERDGNAEIYVMDPDGSDQINLTNNPSSSDTSPAYSPDGSKIVFTSAGEVKVMNPDGTGGTINLTNNPATDTRPSWGPQADSDGDGIGDACDFTTVTNVTSTIANGTYGVGTIIPIQITFSENVTVTGTPLLTLETGATDAIVTYAFGSGTNTLTFNYTVAAGHGSADLDYVSASSLSTNGGTIKDAAAKDAVLTLPTPGAAGSLGANKNIVIDSTQPQTITFGELSNKKFGDPDFAVSATASSGLPVTLRATGNCTMLGNKVHLTGAGSCTVTASQDGDANFLPAPEVARSFSIAKNTQTIAFGALANKTVGDPDFALSATATSGFPVSFGATGQCTVTGNALHITGAGSCTVTASQPGNENFMAAPDVAHSFTIANSALVMFSQTNYDVNESAGLVTITVNRTGDLSVPVNVDYATDDTGSSDVCGTLNSGMASSRCDFGLTLGTLKFAATETQKTFTIPITQDSYTEGPELFTVKLSNPIGTGAALVSPSSATVTINDSASPAPNAIDDTEVFVRQHYRDFLNREADPAGLAFWTGEINNCTPKPQCTELKRINASAAFFLSIEFQRTGKLVRSFYVAALKRPATNNMPEFVEFLRDTQAMQRGVIVDPNNNAWETVLSNNQDAFMRDFVTRAELVGLYPTTDTPTQYVDKLYLNAGITPTADERSNAIAEFGTAATAADAGARGRALLDVTENTTFQKREMNPSFVQMQYFGYLRRNPNDAPDGSFAGYDFWLAKLNQFNGNFQDAEMVKAFISSSEYRHRFGP